MRSIFTKFVLLALSLSPLAAASNQTINPATQINWPKVTGSGAPSGGACTTNYGQPYTQTTGPHYFVCTPTGWFQVDGGGGGGPVTGSGTTGYLPAWTSTTSLGNSHIDDGITTASTLTSTEPFAVNDGSGKAGAVSIKQGTAQSNSTTSVTLTTPTSVTSYRIVLPGVAPTSGNTFLSCTAADPAVCTWAAGGGGGGGGYTNVTGSASETTVALINTACGSGTYYATTALSIATGGTITCPVQFSKSGLWTIASGQTVIFSKAVTETDAPAQHFAGSGVIVLAPQDAAVEWWGAVGDGNYSAGTGTDNAAAINACNTAMTGGQCLLQGLSYRISSALTFNKSSVGLSGNGNGLPTAILTGVAQPSLIFTTSASIDLVDIGGSSPTVNSDNQRFANFTVARTTAPTGTATGIKIAYSLLTTLDKVDSHDSVYDFYLRDSRNSTIRKSWAYFCAGVVTSSFTSYGFYFDTASSVGLYSTSTDGAVMTNNCGAGTRYGAYLTGSLIADLFMSQFETSNASYGFYVDDTSSSSGIASFDIHCNQCILDNNHVAGYYINNLDGGQTGAFEILGGQVSLGSGGSHAIDIESSFGVQVHGVQIVPYSGNPTLVYANASQGLLINDNTCYLANSSGNCFTLNNTTNSTVTGNSTNQVFPGTPTNTRFVLTGSSNNNLTGNTCQGYGTSCVTFDATSNNNTALGTSAGTNITTPYSDSGSGNLVSVNGSLYLPSLSGTGAICPNGTGNALTQTGCSVTTPLRLTETTAPTAATSIDTLWADSTSHRLKSNPNNAGAVILSGTTAARTGGNCVSWDSNGIDLVDAGGACGVAGGGSAFSAITTGSNTTATMTVGSGGTLTVSGTGVNNANQVNGATVAANLTSLATDGSGHIVAGSSGGSFPFTIIQSEATTLAACTSCTWTFTHALQSSGATAMLVMGVDGTTTAFTPPSGWTCTISVTNPSQTGTSYPRLTVCLVASAGQTSVSFSGASMIPGLRLYEFSGTRTFDVTSGTGFTSGAPSVLDYTSITPTSGAAVFAFATGVDATSNQVLGQIVIGRPDWNSAEWSYGASNNRTLLGAVYTKPSDGTSIKPPEMTPSFSPLSSSGFTWAVFSIK